MAVDTSKPVLQTVGCYDLLEKIAEGGMGAVYKARQNPTGQIVAVKVVPPSMTNNPVLLKRFEQEFRAASILDHPNIVRALDFGCSASSPYLVMEYVDGESLGRRLEREGKLPENEAIKIIAQVAKGLHRAHKQGLIHRDVKPDNILVTADGQAKLADLGLVKEVEGDLNLTRTGRGLGTPHFMAPEQFRNAKNADKLCDIYSMAATLYMMVTGELPFKSCGPLDAWMKKVNNELTPPRTVNPALSERIDWAIRRAMSYDREQRPATCREFVEDLTGRSTRRLPKAGAANGAASQDFWYLVYRDEEDELHTVKGTVGAVRRSLKEGLLGDASNVRAGRCKDGPFEPLRSYPEFRDLVVSPAPLAVQTPKTPPAVTSGPGPLTPRLAPATGRPSATPTETGEESTSLHITFDRTVKETEAGHDWIKWVLLFLIAAATAIAGFVLFPGR
jgi:serine/threonine protein kinase